MAETTPDGIPTKRKASAAKKSASSKTTTASKPRKTVAKKGVAKETAPVTNTATNTTASSNRTEAKSRFNAALEEAKAALQAGDEMTAGAIFAKVQAQDPANAPLVEAFQAKNEDPSGAFVFPAYAAVQVIADGIKLADSTDTEAVAEALRSNSFETPTGTLAFDEKGDLKDFNFVVYEWHADATKTAMTE